MSGPVVVFGYDGDGLRVTKQVGSGPVEGFVWDTVGGLPLLLADAVNVYVYGPDGALVQQADRAVDHASYPIHDLTGSIRVLVDEVGTVELARTWDAYGNQTVTDGLGESPFGYAGEYHDTESGLIYLRARYYDPATAQFLTRDPLVTVSRDPYGYTEGNPHQMGDPTGLCPWCAVFAAGFAVGAINNAVSYAIAGNAEGTFTWTELAKTTLIGGVSGGAGGVCGYVGGMTAGAACAGGASAATQRAFDRVTGSESSFDSYVENALAATIGGGLGGLYRARGLYLELLDTKGRAIATGVTYNMSVFANAGASIPAFSAWFVYHNTRGAGSVVDC